MNLAALLAGLRLHDPLWLAALPPLWALGLWAMRRRRPAVLFSDVRLVDPLPQTWALRVRRWLPWVRLAGLSLLVVAMARPQQGREEFRLRTEGIAIQMCIDRSESMEALDFEIDGQRANRLDVVKKVFREFVEGKAGLPGHDDDQIGLLAFGGFVEDKCPLTLDHGALLQVLDTVEIPTPVRDAQGRVVNARLLQEDGMTAIGDAITVAVERLKNVPAKSRIIILLSDGEQTAGIVTPEDAAKTAKQFGIRIYSIGIGTTGTVPFPTQDMFGRRVLQPMEVRLDEKTLAQLADDTGGRYFNAQDTQTLQNVYREIDRLERSAGQGRLYSEYREWYGLCLWPGVALVVLVVVLVSTRFRGLP